METNVLDQMMGQSGSIELIRHYYFNGKLINDYVDANGVADQASLLPSCLVKGSYKYPRFILRTTENNRLDSTTKRVNWDSTVSAGFNLPEIVGFLTTCKYAVLRNDAEGVRLITKNYRYVGGVKQEEIINVAEVMFGSDTNGYFLAIKRANAEYHPNHKFYFGYSKFYDIPDTHKKKLVDGYTIGWLDSVIRWFENVPV